MQGIGERFGINSGTARSMVHGLEGSASQFQRSLENEPPCHVGPGSQEAGFLEGTAGASRIQIAAAQPGYYYRVTYNTFDGTDLQAREQTGHTDANGGAQLVLPPRQTYTLLMYSPRTGNIGYTVGMSGSAGQVSNPTVFVYLPSGGDLDSDGIPDLGENILGTSDTDPDSDADGIPDAAELEQGLNPLDNRGFPTGAIASLPLMGEAQGVDVQDDTIYVATGSHGLAIVDGSRFDNPIVQGQIDLTGTTLDVGVDTTRRMAAVAGQTKLHFVDVSDPMAPAVVRSLDIAARQVEVASGFAFATSGAALTVVDLDNGEIVQRLTLPGTGEVTGLAREGNRLFAYISGSDTLIALDITVADDVQVLGTLSVGIASTDVGLTAGGGTVWLAGSGLRAVDVSSPAMMRLVGQPTSGPDNFSSRRVALNGSGLALVLADGAANVSLYDSSDRARTGADRFLTRFDIPGSARGIAISRGIAYIATAQGLQVVNYRPFDTGRVAPTASVVADTVDAEPATDGVQVLEGTRIPLQALVSDDVQVRKVEFLMDGQPIFTDVSFPFDPIFVAPLLAGAVGRTISFQVRATDTGGNVTLSDAIAINVVPDRVGPTIQSISPTDGSSGFSGLRTVRVRFSETVDAAAFTDDTVRLEEAGVDGIFATPDDRRVSVTRDFRNNDQLLLLQTAEQLPAGHYRVVIEESGVKDAAGNALGSAQRASLFDLATRPSVENLFDLRGTEIATGADYSIAGEQIRLGFNPDGSFIRNDRNRGVGAGIEFLGVEFVEPATPLAGFTISFGGVNYTNDRPSGGQAFQVTREDISVGSFHGVRIVGIINNQLRVERIVGFNDGEEFLTVATRLTNFTDHDLTGVAFLENMDPDQGQTIGIGANSENDLSDDQHLITAGVSNSDYPASLTIGLGSADPRARATAEGFRITNPRDVLDSPNDPNGAAGDLGIACAIDVGTLRAGESSFGSMLIVLGRSRADALATYERYGSITG